MSKPDEQPVPPEPLRDMDDVLRRMLNTPPKPMKKPEPEKKKPA